MKIPKIFWVEGYQDNLSPIENLKNKKIRELREIRWFALHNHSTCIHTYRMLPSLGIPKMKKISVILKESYGQRKFESKLWKMRSWEICIRQPCELNPDESERFFSEVRWNLEKWRLLKNWVNFYFSEIRGEAKKIGKNSRIKHDWIICKLLWWYIVLISIERYRI